MHLETFLPTPEQVTARLENNTRNYLEKIHEEFAVEADVEGHKPALQCDIATSTKGCEATSSTFEPPNGEQRTCS